MTNPIPSKKRRRDPEILLCMLLLITLLFEVLVTGILLVRTFRPSSAEPSLDGNPTTSAPTDAPEPELNAPTVNGDTVNLASDSAVTSKYVLLMNADTWEVIAQKNAEATFSPASMTKVMTLLVAVEALSAADLNQNVVLSQEVVNYISKGDYAGTSVSLPQVSNGISCIGDHYRMKDLQIGRAHV